MHLQKLLHYLKRLPASLCIWLILGIRPLLGPAACRYQIGCTKYAIALLKTEPFLKAVWRIIKRVLSCNPLT